MNTEEKKENIAMEDDNMKKIENVETLISLKEIIETCIKIHNGELDETEQNNFAKKIKFIPYINLENKTLIIMKLLFQKRFPEENDIGMNMMDIEKYKFWDILLRYTNIDIYSDEAEELKTLANYNIVVPIIYDYIFVNCASDYNRFIEMLNNILNFNNIQNLMEFLSNLKDIQTGNEWEEIEKKIKYIDENKEGFASLFQAFNNTSL